MTTATAKRGRKAVHYRTRNGKLIEGLTRISDGRWKVIGTQIRFSEPYEQRAIQRFYELTNDRASELDAMQVRNRRHNFVGIDWEAVAKEIYARPKWVAEKTGIEQIAYLRELQPPKPLPTFKELEQTWRDHFNKSPEQKRKVLAAGRTSSVRPTFRN